jgi:hypothetical protein
MKKRGLPRLCRPARQLLRGLMPFVLLVGVVLLVSALEAYERDPIAAGSYYPQTVEYIVASMLLLLGGAFLIDRVAKKGDR